MKQYTHVRPDAPSSSLRKIEIKRMPSRLVNKLHILAKQRGMTRDQLVIDILTRELDRQ